MTSLLSNTLTGSQVPRTSSYPPYADSRAGQLAIAISHTAGLVQDPWQEYVLRHGLGQNQAGRWAAREVVCIASRQNGKGGIIIARELAGLFIYKEELIIHTAHRFNTSDESFRRIVGLCKATPELDRQVKRYHTGSAKKGIELRDGRWLRFLARSRDSARGLTANCIIVDEGYGLSFEELSALGFTVSAVDNHQIWYFSTPPLDAASSAPLYRLRERALAQDPRLAYFDWGAEADADLNDPKVWAASNPALGIRIELDTIASERASLPDTDFARERLGIWPEVQTGNTIIDPALWAACADEHSAPEMPIALAIDVAPAGLATSVALAAKREDGRLHVELVDHRSGTGWVVDAVRDLVSANHPVAVALDPSAPAGSLVTELEAAGIELLKLSARDLSASCGGLVDAVREDQLRHLDDRLINEALAGARTKLYGDDSWRWTRRNTKTDISPLVAITIARHAFLAKATTWRKPYNILDSVR